MKLILGSDKSGFILKEAIRAYLDEENIEYEDVGTQDIDVPKPFFDTAPVAAKLLQKDPARKAILICGTGMGMSQVANKFSGVWAACCESVYAAHMCRAVNNSNALCMGGWVIGPEMGIEMVKTFLNTAHTEGLEEWRQEFLRKAADKVNQIDMENRREDKNV
ncbi:MAG: RpiB/LacA/LacB family sugar-phosphate isomerase [Oscillospiraceae bacterium]|nr:RpiB/LacA/LacB family sugar-phosphate isomerase [Oscillospiraceae bacterium]